MLLEKLRNNFFFEKVSAEIERQKSRAKSMCLLPWFKIRSCCIYGLFYDFLF
jgi:hypothetical protein